jgi:hypothetical protein
LDINEPGARIARHAPQPTVHLIEHPERADIFILCSAQFDERFRDASRHLIALAQMEMDRRVPIVDVERRVQQFDLPRQLVRAQPPRFLPKRVKTGVLRATQACPMLAFERRAIFQVRGGIDENHGNARSLSQPFHSAQVKFVVVDHRLAPGVVAMVRRQTVAIIEYGVDFGR